MPEEEKVKPSEKLVDIDTSGPETDVAVEEVKEEAVVETKEEEPKITEVEKEEPKKEEDTKLEEYSKGVQGRIAKLTRKMREAERREAAATEYASSLEQARRVDQDRFQKVDSAYTKKFEDNIKTGMDSAQNDLARAIERHVTCEFIAISSYGDSTESSGIVQITRDLTESIEGKDVLIVEDIVDTGLTMSYLLENFKTRKPRSVKICSLLVKPENVQRAVDVDYIGFTIPNKFVVGYGLDYHAGRYRNLPFVGVYCGQEI